MFGSYCIAFIEYMTTGKSLLGYINLISPIDYEKDNKIMYNYYKDKYVRRNHNPKLWIKENR